MKSLSTVHYASQLAVAGLSRFPKRAALVVITVALGIAACMTTLTLLHVLSADPLPGRSQNLYLAWVDTLMARPQHSAACSLNGVTCGVTFDRIKLHAAQTLLAAHRAARRTVVAGITINEVSGNGLYAENQKTILATTSAFIPMFGVALRYGRDWTPAEDAARDPVAVIDVQLARKLFGTADAVGQSVRLNKTLFRVVGVMQRFEPEPHFYALQEGTYDTWENMYVPYTAALDAGLEPDYSDDCDTGYKPPNGFIGTAPQHCASLGLWAQLDTPQQVANYRTFLQNYVDQQQRALASWGKQPESKLISVAQWLKEKQVVPASTRVNVWFAVAFLVLCMLNVMGLLSARFLRRRQEIGIRRALGARRGDVFLQHILEGGFACLLGGALAIPLTLLGLWILRRQGSEFASLIHVDPAMLGALIVLSIVVGALVGLLPAWRAAVIEPGLQVKSE
ncbi:MAG TPA: ABC transporter permease [Rhodanobacteraceae bacterium]|nr:ABC transporter permease [Rhodanobacteraceae bacterium]